ncbi:MAG: HNH endonuclease [Sediminibacterium sp.]|uniref:HNH endonuclease n=1 Tax=Sediminibacterium sp. TaxID=1917865 RepID=UPI003A100565
MVCRINFEKTYGELGKGFIHVHHNKPLFSGNGEQKINPALDLDVLCPNCHAMIHRSRKIILSVTDLKKKLKID